MQLFLLLLLASVEINSGVPGIVDYRIPDGFQTGSLPGDSTYAVLDGVGVFSPSFPGAVGHP